MMTRRGFVVRLALGLGAVGLAQQCKTQPAPEPPRPHFDDAPLSATSSEATDYGRVKELYARVQITPDMIADFERYSALRRQILEQQLLTSHL